MNLSDFQSSFPHLTVRENEPLCRYTTFRLGGPCPLLIDQPRSEDMPGLVRFLNRCNVPFLVIGQGANLVISDEGLNRAVIRFFSETPDIKKEGCRIVVSGDTLLDDLAVFSVRHKAGDFSFCSGIPGTVGGAIAGNAGAFGRQIGDHLMSATLLSPRGEKINASKEDLSFSYRHSRLKTTGEIVFSAVFSLRKPGRTGSLPEEQACMKNMPISLLPAPAALQMMSGCWRKKCIVRSVRNSEST